MRFWHELQLDLIGDRSDEPRVPIEQLKALHRRDVGLLAERSRSRAWEPLVSDQPAPAPRRRPGAARAWGRRFGLAVNLLVSALVSQLLFLVAGTGLGLTGLVAGGTVGLVAGLSATAAFIELSKTSRDIPSGGRR